MNGVNLEGFKLTRLHLDHDMAKDKPRDRKGNIAFSWGVSEDDENPNLKELTFDVQTEPPITKGVDSALSIEVSIVGWFALKDGISDEVLLINGSTILYGILTGLTMGMSGAFENGNKILPTIDLTPLIQKMLKERHIEAVPKKPSQAKKAAVSTKKDSKK